MAAIAPAAGIAQAGKQQEEEIKHREEKDHGVRVQQSIIPRQPEGNKIAENYPGIKGIGQAEPGEYRIGVGKEQRPVRGEKQQQERVAAYRAVRVRSDR